jgi:hypothetical protein
MLNYSCYDSELICVSDFWSYSLLLLWDYYGVQDLRGFGSSLNSWLQYRKASATKVKLQKLAKANGQV